MAKSVTDQFKLDFNAKPRVPLTEQLNLRLPKPEFPAANPNMGSKISKIPFAERAGTAVGKFVKPLMPFIRATPGIGTAIAVGSTLMSDVDKTEEERTFPRAGAVADETRRLQGEADGFWATEKEGLRGALPLVGGLMRDVYDRVSNFYGSGPDLGPGIELTPGAKEGIKTGIPYKTPVETPAATTAVAKTSGSKYDDLLLARLSGPSQPKPPMVKSNESYFINNQTGETPGEKQYFKDLPGTTLNDSQLPQRLPSQGQAQAQGQALTSNQSPSYESPMVAAVENLNLAQFDASRDSFGDLLGKRLHNVNEGGKLLPALARTKELTEQQRQGETDRGFGLEALGLGQDKAYQSGTLELRGQELGEQRRSSDITNIVRLRNTDVNAAAKTSAAAAKTNKPLTYKQQLAEQGAITEIGSQLMPTAPVELIDIMPSLVKQGATPESIAKAFRDVMAIHEENTGSTEVTPENLIAAVVARLNQ